MFHIMHISFHFDHIRPFQVKFKSLDPFQNITTILLFSLIWHPFFSSNQLEMYTQTGLEGLGIFLKGFYTGHCSTHSHHQIKIK